MRLFYLLIFVCFSSAAFAQVSERLNRLNIMFEGNLSGAAYVKHCDTADITGYPLYIENAQSTMLSLANEMLKMDHRLTPAQVEQTLRKKQSDMEAALNQFYISNGCTTSQAVSAKKHFDMFNEMPSGEVQEFLQNIENR